jgi:hypothetical protein
MIDPAHIVTPFQSVAYSLPSPFPRIPFQDSTYL